jgi:hypothetical protein
MMVSVLDRGAFMTKYNTPKYKRSEILLLNISVSQLDNQIQNK